MKNGTAAVSPDFVAMTNQTMTPRGFGTLDSNLEDIEKKASDNDKLNHFSAAVDTIPEPNINIEEL
jgi:hypothetical protein